ncbi:MAG: Arm DNA-binding domain-containing protein [Synergistaceae bacterium]|nr:Arm DNA-binding domain-containing protein [Synergistaceae bacterium]
MISYNNSRDFVPHTGRKYWKVRCMVDGQAKKVTLGEYPYVSLKEARRKRDDVRGMAITGQEPQKPRVGRRMWWSVRWPTPSEVR